MKRVATIDIGTNTILLLIAEIDGKRIKPILERETIVRLGEGLSRNGVLLNRAMERGLRALEDYVKECNSQGVKRIFAVGTSALREAKNSADFLKWIKEKLSLPIEIISAEEEAKLSFLAVTKDLINCNKGLLVVDVGGGSTELIYGRKEQMREWVSLPIGSIRLTEELLHSDPVLDEEWTNFRKRVSYYLKKAPLPKEHFQMVAVGGTATTLASVEQGLKEFIPEKIHHFILKKEALRNQLLLYRSKTIEGRKKISGLSPARAEVILAGATILYLAMETLGCSSLLISCHGVRYGLLYKKLTL